MLTLFSLTNLICEYLKTKNIVGLDIKPEIPKKPDITIANDLNKSYNSLKNELELKILKLIKKNEKIKVYKIILFRYV